ncbi:MAG: site-2 protease family protein [Candidatus Eisenbacteria bacterium]|uniref:Site-2 protease family protein n=1 Tax=Eiseniibacteriota bacterium TaxID=2212470 RepID=A0A9D6QJX6_UNCEI|nr:site-2 protease family protein [Candidatus Eisenbacteria bacterium]MBI3539720.1 site-2 protease family protein [Candidatus Eisenbacteria bacterium]
MHFDATVLLTFPVFLVSIIVHECAHAFAALRLGDTTARDRGRLTLNPLPHIDPVGSVVLPLALLAFKAPFLFGWAKPVPVDWARLRHPQDDQVKVALAGPASNFLLALCFAALVRLAPEGGFWAPLGIVGVAGVWWNCALGLFNLIPVPPLDGSWVLMRFLPLRHIIVLQQFRLVGMALVVALLSTPMIADPVIHRPLRLAVRACLGLFGVAMPGGGL